MNRTLVSVIILLINLSISNLTYSQSNQVEIKITPNHADCIYKIGEEAELHIDVLKNNININNITLAYEYGREAIKTDKKETINLPTGKYDLSIGTLIEPGFLRCKVETIIEGKRYVSLCTVGFEPEKIQPTVEMPIDFWDYWNKAKDENSKIPLNSTMDIQPDRCTDRVTVYHVSFQSYKTGFRVYGWLAVPKQCGKYPAIVKFPGAGVWKNGPDIKNAENGIIVLSIGIHGIPLTMNNDIYEILRTTTLADYPYYGVDDVDRYYYKRVILSCTSAVSFIYDFPQFNGHLGVIGDSQGGALATITTALDDRIMVLGAYYPALCDLTGYLYNRAGGWPYFFKGANPDSPETLVKKKVTAYYDVVNFAKSIKVPCFYTWGFNDLTCPPTSFYSAYNSIQSSKQNFVVPENGHKFIPEQKLRLETFVANKIKE